MLAKLLVKLWLLFQVVLGLVALPIAYGAHLIAVRIRGH